ncbi:acyl-CoA synthetase [Acrocarpospora pleiomorpha]|uniref:Acyl-CoA synthetase n=1 Tax=Acrocarpospora pleiomorpha TaxID=90975 RepID=A0A5M3XLA5_9ACTN|nr:AMP-binding protein [Acrocarpospora pleiomorpha]GES22024.1 acyl-CoA synthetase [Acrocarpospora pleiomorpha]
MNLPELGFWRIARRFPANVAAVEPDGTQVTARELLARVNRVTRLLRSLGLTHGDRVALVAANEVAALETVLACHQAGWYLVPVNTALSAAEIAHIIGDCVPGAVVTSPKYAPTVRAALDQAGMGGERRFATAPADGFRVLADAASPYPGEWVEDRAAGAFMAYTSGTTGRPKGVLRALVTGDPDDVFAAGAAWQLGMFEVEPFKDGTHLVTSPLSHTAVNGLALTSLHLGHRVVLMERFDAEGMLRLIERERVTTTHVVPTQMHRLLALDPEVRGSYDISSMRNLIHGAGPCPPAVKRGIIDWFGPVVYEYYGASEAAGTVISAREWLARPGSVGRAQPGAAVRIMDEHGRELGPGERGRVYLEMGPRAFEYRGDPDKTRSSVVDDYVTVGDLGYLDEDGYLFLLGRTAEVIVSGGVNVYPAEVEAALLEHPGIADAGVVGVPDQEWGEIVCAVIQPTEAAREHAAGPGFREEIIAFCRDRIAGFKLPRRIEVVDSLPRGANGKLRKHLLLPNGDPGETPAPAHP